VRPLLLLAAAVALVAAFTLAACGPQSRAASPDVSAGGATSAPTSRPHAGNPALSCALVPASLVNAALGTHVGDPDRGGPLDPARIPGFTCTYHQSDDVVVIVFWDPTDRRPRVHGGIGFLRRAGHPRTGLPGRRLVVVGLGDGPELARQEAVRRDLTPTTDPREVLTSAGPCGEPAPQLVHIVWREPVRKRS
jgi:hypothetical protein